MARVELFKAVKYEVENYRADHGMNLNEMWNTVNGRTEQDGRFWYNECLEDYRSSVEWSRFQQWVADNNGIPADPELPFN